MSCPAELRFEVQHIEVWVEGVFLPVLDSPGPSLEEVPGELVGPGAAGDDESKHLLVDAPKVLELTGGKVKGTHTPEGLL